MSVLNGRNLIAMDRYWQGTARPLFSDHSSTCRGGTSDPYVKVVQVREFTFLLWSPHAGVLQGEDELYRTQEKKKTVDPVWNDQFNLYIENPLPPLVFQVNLVEM